MRNLIHTPSYFQDVTPHLQSMKAYYDSGVLPEVIKALDDFCYPRVRCPVGCFMFIDDLLRDRLTLAPATHYMATMCPSFRAFKADAHFLDGARSDWTRPYQDLLWQCAPSVLIDDEKGLMFLMCSSTVHCPPRINRLHVPTNPVLKNLAPSVPDVLAPAVLTSNMCRPGHTGQYNSSFPVYRQTGNTSGLSTFRLSSKVQTYTPSAQIAAAKGLVLQHRPDILHVAQQTTQVASTIPSLLDYYTSAPNHPTDQDVASHKETGSYLDMEDAFFLSDVYNTSYATITPLQQTNNQNPQGNKLQPRHCVLTVHPADGIGSKLLHIPNTHFIGQRNNTFGPIIYSTLMTFLNSSPLNEAFLQSVRIAENISPLQNTLLSVLQQLRTSHAGGPVNRQDIQNLARILGPVQGNFPEQRITRSIQLACNQVGSFQFQTLKDLQQIVPNAESNIIFLTTNALGLENINVPTDMLDGQWHLMLSLSARETFQMHARCSINTA